MVSYCLADKMFVRDLPGHIFIELGRLLNPKSFNNWAKLAGLLGFTSTHVQNFGLEPEEATQNLLNEWGAAGRIDGRCSHWHFQGNEGGRISSSAEGMEQLRCGETGNKNVQLVLQKLCFAFYQPHSNLLQVAKSCCRKKGVVLLFATKSVHVARFTGPRQTCFAASYATPAYGATRA